TPEETAMWRRRAKFVWSPLGEFANEVIQFVPEAERQAVILHDIERKTFEEIDELESCAKSTAKARYERGMTRLQEFAREKEACGALLIAPGFLGLDYDGPPPEMVERHWQRFVADGHLDRLLESEPPPSGTRRAETSRDGDGPPSTRPPARRVTKLRGL